MQPTSAGAEQPANNSKGDAAVNRMPTVSKSPGGAEQPTDTQSDDGSTEARTITTWTNVSINVKPKNTINVGPLRSQVALESRVKALAAVQPNLIPGLTQDCI